MSFFSVKGLTAGYGKKTIVRDVSFSQEEGTMLGILGANGSGKTTLLKSICGILSHEGECVLDGVVLDHLSARSMARLCGYIPQRSGITIDISVLDVVLMGGNPWLGLLERPSAAMKEQARQALKQVGLSDRENDNYLTLSEGQKQLCVLARTLVGKNSLLLLDEPESALDFRYRHQMLEILGSWLQKEKRAAVVTLHDPMLALNYCQELLLLKNGRNLGVLHPNSDERKTMEHRLSEIYGPVSLREYRDRKGRVRRIMLKEQEEIG